MSTSILLLALFAVLIGLLHLVSAQTTLNTEDLWKKYRAELFNFLRAGDDGALPGLQLVSTPFPAEWDSNPQILQDIVTRIPKWGPSWEMTNKDFLDAYENFLTNINIPSQPAEDVSRIEAIEDQLFELEMTMMSKMQMCMQAFMQYQSGMAIYEGTTKTFPQYKQLMCYSLIRAEQNIVFKRGELLAVQASMRDSFYDARGALGKFATTPAAERKFTAYGSLSTFAQAARMGQVNGYEVKITSKTSSSSRSTTTQSMGVGFNGNFFGVPVSASLNMQKEEMKFKTSTSDFQLLFGAKGLATIPVFPSRSWYSPEIVEKYSNGPFRADRKYFFDVGTKSFPANAIMPMVVRNLFVVVGPKLEMYVSREDAEELEKKSSFGASFNVAGVDFNFNKGSTLQRSDESSKLSKITITGDSVTPQILAVESQILPSM